jgi:acyl-CoA thioesterase-1
MAKSTDNDHLLIYGDSLSAAYGMEIDQGWVHLLSQDLAPQIEVSNASISGETTSGGLARIENTIDELKPNYVLLELGANDGLRGMSIDLIQSNLNSIIEFIESRGVRVLLAGISLPASYGPRYIDSFRKMYTDLAGQHDLAFIDLYNEEFLGSSDYIQADGLHPTALSQPIIRDSILQFLLEQKIHAP